MKKVCGVRVEQLDLFTDYTKVLEKPKVQKATPVVKKKRLSKKAKDKMLQEDWDFKHDTSLPWWVRY